MATRVGYEAPLLNGSPRRTASARTTASLCSVSRAEKTSVSVPSRAFSPQLRETRTLPTQLICVAPTELLEAIRIVSEPRPQFGARR
jgi:hypothetical protein